MKTISRMSLGAGSLLALALWGASAAFAAEDSLDEITVTAQKREQKLEDVGIAVTAFSGSQIRDLQMHTLSDIVSQTPSLSVSSPLGEGGNQNFTLRGVGLNDFSEHNESPVAAYQDGVYQATIAGINGALFDVGQVEVLRGPQGTLYGRNSTGGLVQFVSKQPTPDYEGTADVSYGSFSEKRVEAAFGGPLGGPFEFRIAGVSDNHNGYGVSTIPGIKSSYGLHETAGRVLVKWQGAGDTSVLFNLHALTNHASGPAYGWEAATYAANGWTQIPLAPTATNPYCAALSSNFANIGVVGPGTDCAGYSGTHSANPQLYNNNRQSFQNLDTNGASITVNSTLGNAAFTSITAYEHVHKFYGEDTDGGPYSLLAVTNPVQSKEFTQEFRLSQSTDKFQWTGGLYYFYRDINTGSQTDQSGVGSVTDVFHDELLSRSAAAFGQVEYSIAPTVTLIGGLRYSHEDQNFKLLTVDLTGLTPLFLGITSAPVPGYNIFPFTGGQTPDLSPYSDTRTDNLVTYRAEVDWKPEKDTLLYGSISKGNKSAGWNGAIDGSGLIGHSTPQNLPYAPEDLLAYEVGFKQLVKDLYRIRAAAFYYDYKNFQAFTFAGYTQQISNLPATVRGAELELTVTPTSHFDLSTGISYLSTEVKGVTVPVINYSLATINTVTINTHMVLAPTWTLDGSARFHVNVGDSGQAGVALDTRYTGRQYFDLDNDPIATQNGQALTNGSIYYSNEKSRLRVTLGVKNLTNRAYRDYAIPVTTLGFQQVIYAPPRWYTLTLGYSW